MTLPNILCKCNHPLSNHEGWDNNYRGACVEKGCECKKFTIGNKMTLSHSKIPYVLNPDGSPGYGWSVFTGCGQPPEVCLTRATCWARRDCNRFGKTSWSKLYNSDFSLKFNDNLLEAPLHLRKPSTIAVAFTGDMFGPGSERYWLEQGRVLGRVWQLPQHRFLFLTKSPENLAQFNPWPPNAWVGCTITGAESPERQQQMIAAMCRVEGGKRWISYEPTLKPLGISLAGIDWIVIGCQSGKGALKPELQWLIDAIELAGKTNTKVWLKKNAVKLFPNIPYRQELPS